MIKDQSTVRDREVAYALEAWITDPNRADTDADGLNDSEELNLGTDGFQTDPWNGDTDGDGGARQPRGP